MKTLEESLAQLKEVLETVGIQKRPRSLYDPMDYLLELGGKRMRPKLCLIATDALGGDPGKAVHAAAAIELFHNFSLMHDDIMDKAPLRRGKPTVHAKWDENQAILSGDAMLVLAYDLIVKAGNNNMAAMLQLFNKTALEVCEGQQMDMDFEKRNDVSVDEYMEMIKLKTSVLVGASLQMGALAVTKDDSVLKGMYDFGLNLGLAFQLRDDYLDTFGESEQTGKQRGGDILADKKTFLYIKTREMANDQQRAELDASIGKSMNPEDKVEVVRGLMMATGAKEACTHLTNVYLEKATEILERLPVHGSSATQLHELSEFVITRSH